MTGPAFVRVRVALEAQGSKVQKTGPDKIQAQCPAHADTRPSLSVTSIEGSVLIHCHGGCHTDDVLATLELKKRDLFDVPHGYRYVYRDRDGSTRRIVSRTPDKKFRQSDILGDPILFSLDPPM